MMRYATEYLVLFIDFGLCWMVLCHDIDVCVSRRKCLVPLLPTGQIRQPKKYLFEYRYGTKKTKISFCTTLSSQHEYSTTGSSVVARVAEKCCRRVRQQSEVIQYYR